MRTILLALTVLMAKPLVAAPEPRVLYEEDPSLLTTVVKVVIHSGTADDPVGKNGLTSLMIELMQRGTKKKSRTKFQSELEKIGGSLSAGTSLDRILFEGRVIRENTGALLALIEDCLLNPAFDKKEFDSLKKEVVAQISHKKNQNSRLTGLQLRKELFGGTPLEYPVEGGLSTVSGLQLEDIKRAYNDRFHQGNIMFAVATANKESEMKPLLGKLWGKFPDGLRLSRRTVPVKVPEKPRLIVIDKPKTSTGSIIFGQAGITAQEKNRYALGTSDFSFGGEPLVSRLFRIVRGELGWTYSINSTYGALGNLSHQQGIYAIVTAPSVEFTGKTILKVLSLWKDYLSSGLKSSELRLGQESLVNSYPFDFESAEKRLSARLHSYLYDVPILSQEQYAKVIGSIDQKGVVDALKAHHFESRWVIIVVADRKAIESQLAEEQKERPAEERLTIEKVLTPEQVIQ